MVLNNGDEVRIRRFKDLCCEYNFNSDVFQNDSVWGFAEDYMHNLNNQGILGDDMHLLCGQIVKYMVGQVLVIGSFPQKTNVQNTLLQTNNGIKICLKNRVS